MSLFDVARQDRGWKRFIVDSAAHTLFYGVVGAGIALALGIDFEIYAVMSLLGTAIQFLSGGLFGKLLDAVRRLANV